MQEIIGRVEGDYKGDGKMKLKSLPPSMAVTGTEPYMYMTYKG